MPKKDDEKDTPPGQAGKGDKGHDRFPMDDPGLTEPTSTEEEPVDEPVEEPNVPAT